MTHPVRPILERLAYVVYLGLVVCSVGITWLGGIVGFITGNFGPMWLAVLGLALSMAVHAIGHARWHFRECEKSLSRGAGPDGLLRTEAETRQAGACATLLARLETAPDVWSRGETRRALQKLLEAGPELREEFEEEISRHPDLA